MKTIHSTNPVNPIIVENNDNRYLAKILYMGSFYSQVIGVQTKEIIRRVAFNLAEALSFRGFCVFNQKTGDKTMRNIFSNVRGAFARSLLAATLGVALAFTFSCSSDDGDDNLPEETYYFETGGISETAYDLVKDLDEPAENLVAYCHRYRAPNDKYAYAEPKLSREELEKELDEIPLPSVKATILRSLDKDGAVFGIFKAGEDFVFIYIEKNS
jgi:hypothetical protein